LLTLLLFRGDASASLLSLRLDVLQFAGSAVLQQLAKVAHWQRTRLMTPQLMLFLILMLMVLQNFWWIRAE